MSARSAAVVEITDAPAFDPFCAPEGWFATPRRLLALFKRETVTEGGKRVQRTRVMCDTQIALILYLENELWSDRGKSRKAPGAWTKPLSLVVLARACGISVQALQPVVDDAIARGLIAQRKEKGERAYRYRLCPENWAHAPLYAPSGIATAEDACENGDSTESTTCVAQHTSPLACSRVKPGEARTIAIAQTGQRLRCRNRVEVEVEVAVTSAVDGLLELDIGVPREEPGRLLDFPRRKPNEKATAPPPPARPASADTAAVRDFLLPRFQRLNSSLDRKTVTRIWGAILESGATLEDYKALARAREKRKMTAGAYVLLAEQDLPAFVEQQREVTARGLASQLVTKEPLTRNDESNAEFVRMVRARQGARNGKTD